MKPSRLSVFAPALISAIMFLPAPCAMAETRQAAAHIHGHGMMNIAIEGNNVIIELEVPGMDILGFEYQPVSDADKQAVKSAISKLSDPDNVFTLPKDAACKAGPPEVNAGAGHDHEEGHEEHEEEPEAEHMEVHAAYELTCTRPEALSSIKLNLFSHFPSLKEIGIQAVTGIRQIKATATADQRSISF